MPVQILGNINSYSSLSVLQIFASQLMASDMLGIMSTTRIKQGYLNCN